MKRRPRPLTTNRSHRWAHVFVGGVFWVTFSIFFYMTWNRWTFAKAFFFTIQSGLSVGFDSFREESSVSKLYTCVHVVVCKILETGALALYAETMAAQLEVSLRKRGESSFAVVLDAFRHRAWMGFVMVATLACVGVFWGMVWEHHSPADAIYFSVTAISTAGILSPDPKSSLSLIFTGLFCLVGVPLCTFAVSNAVALILGDDHAIQAHALLAAQTDGVMNDNVCDEGSDGDDEEGGGYYTGISRTNSNFRGSADAAELGGSYVPSRRRGTSREEGAIIQRNRTGNGASPVLSPSYLAQSRKKRAVSFSSSQWAQFLETQLVSTGTCNRAAIEAVRMKWRIAKLKSKRLQ